MHSIRALAIVALLAPWAHAATSFHMENNDAGFATITDGGQIFDGSGTICAGVLAVNCSDQSPVSNIITFAAPWFGAFNSTTTTGQSQQGNLLDLTGVTTTANAGGGYLRMWWSDTGFTGSGPVNIRISGNIPAHALIQMQVFLDTSNVIFGNGTPLLPAPQWFAGPASGSSAFSFDATVTVNVAGPYSLTQFLYIQMPEQSGVDFDFSVTSVPEPASLWPMLAIGLVALSRRAVKRANGN